MGNFIGTEFALSHNHKKIGPNDNEADTKASAELCEAPLSLAAILKSSDVYRLMPQMIQQSSLKPTPENCNGQRIKIVVTKKQLQAADNKKQGGAYTNATYCGSALKAKAKFRSLASRLTPKMIS
ncbi:hypothetical protein BUALT_Bualt03G0091100 [Buddleja alternifolia]|uniref:Uncharacterized protein n=1 Tax=Buddleja alternifolia TaxID=168488 RepID=A0AAV6XWJ8_9LAMI|nr:hypothetical protein BUALT_Bualt03G0091100 [Buddleja alternifolia]